MSPVNWIYPVNSKSGYVLQPGVRNNNMVSPENIWKMIRNNPYKPDAWYLSKGYRTMNPGDRIWVYSAGDNQFICALGIVAQIEQYKDGDWYAILIWNLTATQALEKNPIRREEYGQIVQSPARANEATSHYLDAWLSRNGAVTTSFHEDHVSEEDARQKREALVVQRQGQQGFRRKLLSIYDGECCATGESTEAVLEAAHIKPYMGPHSNIPSNGLLLRADIHTLFDLHLIAIDSNYKWSVSSQVKGREYRKLHGKPITMPNASRPNKSALKKHFQQLKP